MPSPGKRTPGRARPRTPESRLRRKAQALSGLALETLAAIMKSEGQDSVRLAAAREVLDRGYGRTKLGAAESKAEAEGAPYTVVVQRFSDPPDPKLEDFE